MYTVVGFKIIYVYIHIYKCVIPRATDACKLIDDVNDEFTNSPRERAGP
jgi:hypothetical protein